MKMKLTLLFATLMLSLHAHCQDDYIIHLNDTSISVALDKTYTFILNGKNIDFKLSQKDTLTYLDNFYSFKYPKGLKVSTSKVDEGVQQVAILTAEGTGILIQKHENLNPSSLTEFMLAELTKESISYGYSSKRTTYKKKIITGAEITVTQDVLTYKDDVNIYEITSFGKKDAGFIIITMKMDDDKYSEGQKLIDLMWNSIKPTL